MTLRQTLHALPRDARDTLFQLAVIGWTMLPHFAHLPAWCSAMALAILFWRGRLALRWTLAGFVALMLAYVGSRFVIEVVLHRT